MKQRFIAGLSVVVPVAFVLWVLSLFLKIDTVISSFLGLEVYGVGLLTLIVVIFLSGSIVSTKVGGWFHKKTEKLFRWVPIVNKAYDFAKDAVDIATGTDAFDKVVRFESWRPGIYNIGFLTNEGTVFAPSSPNPLSGQVVEVDKYEVLDISVEDAIKYLSSLGMVKKF